MRYLIVLSMILAAGCSLTPTQKKWASFATGVLVVGAIAAHDMDNGKSPAERSFEAILLLLSSRSRAIRPNDSHEAVAKFRLQIAI